jgi:hypothetical protein
VVLENCPKLSVLNLSGCRGVPTTMRRNAFAEVNAEDDSSSDEPLVRSKPTAPERKTKRKATSRASTARPKAKAALRGYGFMTEYRSEEDEDWDPSKDGMASG